MIKKISFLFYFVIISTLLSGQIIDIDYRIPQEYIIGGVTVSGIQNEESKDLIIMISNLTPGKKLLYLAKIFKMLLKICINKECLNVLKYQ